MRERQGRERLDDRIVDMRCSGRRTEKVVVAAGTQDVDAVNVNLHWFLACAVAREEVLAVFGGIVGEHTACIED